MTKEEIKNLKKGDIVTWKTTQTWESLTSKSYMYARISMDGTLKNDCLFQRFDDKEELIPVPCPKIAVETARISKLENPELAWVQMKISEYNYNSERKIALEDYLYKAVTQHKEALFIAYDKGYDKGYGKGEHSEAQKWTKAFQMMWQVANLCYEGKKEAAFKMLDTLCKECGIEPLTFKEPRVLK